VRGGARPGGRVVLAAAFLASSSAVAAPPSFVGGAGSTLEDAVLISRAGEIYRRDAGVWRRGPGGVAADLVATWGRSPVEVIALGARAPAYRTDGKTWSSVPGGRNGAAVLGAPDAPRPGLAAGKQAFVLERGALRWSPLPPAPGRISALWTRDPRDALALVDGKVHRLAQRWTPVPIPEPVVALGGQAPLALGAGGGVYAVEGRRARRLATPPELRPRLVLGRVLVADDLLARVEKGKIVVLGAPPEAGIAALVELPGGGYLAATRSGRVFTGRPGAWTEERVDAEAPPAGDRPRAPPAIIGPPSSR
jgi:hypothetical protein